MFNRTGGAATALIRAEPTSLLKLIAAEFADAVARIWPAPHAEFLTAAAARRHLLCLGLVLGRDVAALGELVLKGRLRLAVRAVAGDDGPAGLERALSRMGETAWAPEDYRSLLRLLGEPKPAKVLRHAQAIDAEMVRSLSRMPPPMGEATGLALTLGRDGVAVLREAFEALRFRSGEAAALAAAGRWGQARSAKALFEAVRDDLYPEPAAPPHLGTARLKPITSKAGLREAARRFRNCLRDHTPYAASGWSAYYEWTGSPAAVVEISRDAIFGWRLEQARLANNAAVPEELREEITSELALMGVHVGRSSWELERALSTAGGRVYPLRPLEEAVAEAFGVD